MLGPRIVRLLIASLLISASATGQSPCKGRPRPTWASVDAIFLARVNAVEPETQSIGVDGRDTTWPMVRFVLSPRQGWKLDPRKATEMWDPDTTGLFFFSIEPEQAPALRPGNWALVYMKVPVDMVITKPAYVEKTDTTFEPQEGFLDVVMCGIRAVPDTSLGTRLYGRPAWQSDHR